MITRSVEECEKSRDGLHLWVRRRDGKACAYCEARQFGSSDLTDVERQRIAAGLMNREHLAKTIGEMKTTATAFVQRHAAIYARDVPLADVEAICCALGDISIDEATAALDRLQSEIGPARQ